MDQFPISPHNKVRRLADRAAYDRQSVYAIIDECLYCHAGFIQDDLPYVIPVTHARSGDQIFIHGALASRLLKHLATGAPVCLTFTVLDGLVMARSMFEHSVNYRSAVVFGHGQALEQESEKFEALKAISNHLYPGRWEDARQPDPKELHATQVVAIQIDSASVKARSGPPVDKPEDSDRPTWAGIIPLLLQVLPFETEPGEGKVRIPDYLHSYQERVSGHRDGDR